MKKKPNVKWLIVLIVVLFFIPLQRLSANKNTSSRLLLDVIINGNRQNYVVDCYIYQKNELWLKETDIKNLNLFLPKSMPKIIRDEPYYLLNTYKNLKYEIDNQELVLDLHIPSRYFASTRIDLAGPNWDIIRPTIPGGFINYDASIQHTNVFSQTNTALISEVGYFNRYGIGTTDFFIRGGNSSATQFVRLESVWTLDEPEKLTTWNIGDSITTNFSWSGAVRFAGIQWGTNFNTQPYLVTAPLPAFSGQAVVPTTLSVFVNDALNVTKELSSGPFTLYDIPVVTGEGTVRVVTNDILGRQRETIIPYYSSQQLLKKDLIDFSYELGIIRDNFGLNSFDYSELVGVGTYTKGLTNTWTAGWHAELMGSQQTFGVASNNIWDQKYLFLVGSALSHNCLGWGGLLQLGIQRQTQDYSFGFQITPATPYFADLGLVEDQPAPSLQMQSFATIASTHWGTLSASYTVIKNRISDFLAYQTNAVTILPNAQLLTLNYSRNVANDLYVVLGSIIDLNQSSNTVSFLSLIWGFKENYSLSSTASFQSGDNQQTALLNKNLPWGNGYGYHLSLTDGNPNQGEAFYAYQNDYGTYSAQIAKIGSQTNYLGEVAGSIVNFAGHTILSRELYNSFALVILPDFEDICVYNRNSCVGKTNKSGVLLVPNLLPYQKNTVNIDVEDFPLSTDIPIVEIEGIPYYRSGILMEFPVKKVNNITMQLVTLNKQPVPVGAMLMVEGSNELFPVVEQGYVFATSEKSGRLKGKVMWHKKECQFKINLPTKPASVYRLGEITCY